MPIDNPICRQMSLTFSLISTYFTLPNFRVCKSLDPVQFEPNIIHHRPRKVKVGFKRTDFVPKNPRICILLTFLVKQDLIRTSIQRCAAKEVVSEFPEFYRFLSCPTGVDPGENFKNLKIRKGFIWLPLSLQPGYLNLINPTHPRRAPFYYFKGSPW